MTLPLSGKRLVVPESRQLDLFAKMLEDQGAETIRCPMVTILDLDDPAPVLAWLAKLNAGAFDDLILLTGEGLRRIMGVAQSADLEPATKASLAKLRTITRGPKPVRALRELSLSPGITAEEPTTQGVIATLAKHDLKGRRVGVQLYPGNPNDALMDFLRDAGATAETVTPYRYASDAETTQVETVIREIATGKIDAIAFTSTPQVKRLVEVARERGLESELRDGLACTRVASIGPVVSEVLTTMGIKATIMPAGDSFHMKPLVNAIVAAFAK